MTYLYTTSLNNAGNILFQKELKSAIDNFVKLKEINDENLETIVIPIHRIFYRFFVKGGATLKVFVDYLEEMDIIDKDDIPIVANAPTDIDTNLIINPHFTYAYNLNELLKSLIEKACLVLMDKHAKIYTDINE